MTRRSRVAIAMSAPLATVIAFAATGHEAESTAARGMPDRPNIVVIMTDDQRADDVRVMTQVRKLIARRGTTFANAFATFPLCCPSRATYLTGQYAHNHGVLSNLPPDGGVERLNDQETVPLALHEAGYRTGWIGKYLNGYFRIAPEVPPGYDDWRVRLTTFRAFGGTQVINGRVREWGESARDYATDIVARQSKKFIHRSLGRTEPFFLTIQPDAPHREHHPPGPRQDPRAAPRHKGLFSGIPFPRTPAFNERDVSDKPSLIRNRPRLGRRERSAIKKQRLARLESLLAVDDLVNSVIRTLKRGDALEDTLVVFTSDNGFQLGEHRHYGKTMIYEESTRVPLIMRGPGVPQGAVVDELAANLDLPATIYERSGVEPAVPQDGISLFDLIEDPAAFADRTLMFHTFRVRAVRTSRYVYAEHDAPSTPQLDDEVELYDLERDPRQLESAHVDPALAAVRALLAARLDQLRDCAGASCH